jgi:hypothetical protein
VSGTSFGCIGGTSTGNGWLDAAKVGAVTLTDGNGGVLRGSAAPVSGGGDLINCGSADDGDGDTTSDD